MQEGFTRIAILISALFLLGSLPLINSVSAEDEVDNWPSGDAWLYIELLSWSANETVEWDNNNGLPDPHFEICIEADGVNIDCIDTPTWDNQMELVNPWNYSIDIPDYSNILNITIECRDNDAINDDECDMNSELDEWKLFAEYNWSLTPTKGVIGNGDGDGNGTWKNAASEWRFTIDGYGDEDSDGVSDNLSGTAYGNDMHVISGVSGTILTSSDNGSSWTTQTTGTSEVIWEVIYNNNIFVSVSDNGSIYTSEDGTTWTPRTSGTSNPLIGITYGNSTFVAVGNSGTIYTSTDGTTWTSSTSGTSNDFKQVAYGNSTFVAVGNSGTIYTSPDGTTWTSSTSGTSNALQQVAYGNSTFVVISNNGEIFTSADGTTWTLEWTSGTTSLNGITFTK